MTNLISSFAWSLFRFSRSFFFASPLDEEFIPITQIPPLHLLEDVLVYKYWVDHKIVLRDLHYQNYGKWLKVLSDGVSVEEINELLKKIC